MHFDPEAVQTSFTFDTNQLSQLRQSWLLLMDLGVFGDVKSSRIGATDRLRKRLLEIGEGLRSLTNNRQWIPHPREQIKSAMGASIKIRDTLLGLERAAQSIDGGTDYKEFEKTLLAFRQSLLQLIEHHEGQWTMMLEKQYGEEEEDD